MRKRSLRAGRLQRGWLLIGLLLAMLLVPSAAGAHFVRGAKSGKSSFQAVQHFLPRNSALPGISGTVSQGQVLTAANGAWLGEGITYTYQWRQCNSSGEACSNISGATASLFTLRLADVGHTIRLVATGTNVAGSGSATSAPTVVVGSIAGPQNTSLPVLSGTAAQGQTLSTTTGTWTGPELLYTYQWQDCDSEGNACTNISLATASSYTLAQSDGAHTIRAVVTATNGAGPASASSAKSASVTFTAAVNTVLPSISGITQAGQLLTATTGTWTGGGIAYSYQWRLCNSSGEACSSISGATSSTYTPVAGDAAHTIRVAVTATNTGGAVAATSAQTAVIGSGAPANTVLPLISGVPKQGQTLSTTNGTWSYAPTGYAYQWQDCNSLGEACSAITGATSSTYKPLESDVGKTIRVVVSATNTFGTTPASSEKTGTVVYASPELITAPVISGTAQQGQMLSTSNGTWTGGGISYSYQWQRCNSAGEACESIAGATASGYTAQAADVGHTLRSSVTASNTGGNVSATSEKSAVVLVEAPVSTVLPAIAGTVQQGQTVSSSTGTWSNSPTGYAYQWRQCNSAGESCSSISGATSATYSPVEGDVGKTLRSVVTATNAGGSASATSEKTTAVLYASPVNTVLPVVSGTTQAGQTLTATTGTWTGGGIAYSYQWRQCNAAGEACSNISGATSSAYATVAGDATHTIRVVVTATNTGAAVGATSAQTTVIGSGAPANTVLPIVSGTAQQGQTLTTTNGTWSYSPTGYAYQWQDCNTSGAECAAISGATSVSYKAVESDVGKTIRAQVTATNTFGSTAISSEKTSTIIAPYTTPVNTVLPLISGTAQQGQTLTITNGTWTGGGITYSYQWRRCNTAGEACENISGATASSYVAQAADVGKTIRIIVTATNTAGSTPATSEKTATVLIEAPVNSVLPAVYSSETYLDVQQGEGLGTGNGTWSNSPTGYAYQWRQCNSLGEACTNLTGATTSSYVPVASDVTHTLRVAVTATGAGGSTTATSVATGAVAGPITEFTTGITAKSEPTAIAAGADGNLWFTEYAGIRIGRITTAGVISQFSIASSARPEAIAAGADGNLWFTEINNSRIGRITPAGVITEFSTGMTSGASPEGITAGPDGNVWFTEAAGNRIGRITPAGVITEFSTGITAESAPAYITAGGDGNLWFTEANGNRIGRITTAGVVTEFSTGITAGSEPSGIVAGSDGNLWFTEGVGTRIGRITTAGVVTQYTGLNVGSAPHGIAAGADGSLYFVEGGGRLGRITTTGVVNQFAHGMSEASGPQGIAAGSDGNLWFVETSGARIGRLAIGGPVNAVAPTVSGNAQQGQTLTITNGTWTGTPTPTYGYSWQRCNTAGEECATISGASASTYTLVEADVGKTIRGVATGTNTLGVTPAPSAATAAVGSPVNTVLPVISGTAQQGQTLTITNGTWTGSGISYSYQWTRCNTAGEACENITGATASSYVLQAADVGKTVRIVVTATNTNGSTPATSEKTSTVLVGAPGELSPPSISGTVKQGQTVTVSTGTWENSPTSYGYQWKQCNSVGEACSNISGATANTYVPVEGDVGKTLEATVTATNAGGFQAGNSGTTTVVLYANPVNTVLPTVSGTTQAGQTLTATTGTWTGGGIAYSYQWRQCNSAGEACSNISGATSSAYTTVAGDATHTIRVVVTATNTGAAVPATSAQTAAIGSGAPANTVLPSVTGTAQQGQTLTTTNGTWSYSPTGYAYQWQDCNTSGAECSAISGATSVSYKAVESDVGKTIRAQVTATNSFGSTAISSEKTSTVTYAIAVNTAAPVISGTAQEGSTLTTTNGTWTGSGLSYSYAWQRCNTSGAECAAITGATASGYAVQAADVGHTIRIVVGAENTGGTAQATSEKTSTVAIAAPTVTVFPVVSGNYQQGETLTTTSGTWTGTGITYAYEWYDCNSSGSECKAISGATTSTYKLVASDVAHTVTPNVTATNAGGASSVLLTGKTVVAGAITEFSSGITASSNPLGIAKGPEGNLWFAEKSGNRIARVTPAGVVTEFSTGITASSEPRAIVAGPDGNLWFTEAAGTRIGRITPAGVVTEFSTGITGGSYPYGIAVGPDGNLWFTERIGNKIGRITTAGVVTEFSTGITASSGPWAITAGGDGNLWFTEYNGTRIGRITTAGVVTEFSTGLTAGSNPDGITAGPDGNVWFTEYSGNKIGMITPSGVITEYPEAGGSHPYGIVAGADGNLWFSEYEASKIGRITTAGVSTEFSNGITASSKPTGIAAGADGNLWFTEEAGNRVGRLSIGGPVNTVAPTVSGTAQQGKTLTIANGTWTGTPTPTYAYTWQRCNTAGEECAAISGATSSTYTLVEADVGKTVRGVATATNTLGVTPAPSAQTSTVTYATAVNTVLPVISGTAQEGSTLTTTNGTWTGSGLSYYYIWQRCNTSGAECAAITGATASSYVLQAADVGHTIKIVVGAENTGGSSQATSEKTATVTVGAPSVTVFPVVSGTYQQGETLTTTTGTWTGTGITYTYEWYDCNSSGSECKVISGATASTYKLVASDVAHTVTPNVNATNAGGTSSVLLTGKTVVVGAITEFSSGITASSQPIGMAKGPEGNLWFTEKEGNRIGRITPTGTVTQFSTGITSGAVPTAITAGGDGNMWFTEYSGNRIGRITPAGVITEFSTGISASGLPWAITAGPDGNVWFTEVNGNRIGRITPAGVVTEYTLPASSEPRGITAGADGNLWFTDAGTAKIGRITTAGVITEFSTGITASSYPYAITAGPDGNLWFTEREGNRIARITTAGVVTEFSAGLTGGAAPYSIVSGADGNLYFSENTGNRIGRITTAGVISEFSAGITAASEPHGIAAGADGNLWFSEYAGSRVGRLAIGGPVNTVLPTVSGTVQQGQTLTIANGTWTGTPTPTYAYTWQRCNTAGEECAAISGATSSTYTLVEADVGKTVRGVATATNTVGVTPASSAQTATVSYAAAVNTAVPVISGSVGEGQTLTTTTGTWTGVGITYAYIWQRCNTSGAECVAISGATASTYVLQAADVGHTIKTTVTAENSGGSAQAQSAKTATITPPAPTLTVAPVMSGITQQGETLSTTKGTWTGSGITYSYQWYRCTATATECEVISGATAITYKLLATEVGHTIKVVVVAENAGGPASFVSGASSVVTGSVTEFSTPSSSSEPLTVVTGPEGNLWFTESNANKIGRITPSGVMTEFSTGITSGADPYGITLGPDGNLWFTEYLGSRIGRITPAGVVTEFSSGLSAGSVPVGIVKGNDGNLWFTESSGNRIGRITTAGVITQFSTGITASSAPLSITAGSDGNLWFTESSGNRIGRITTAGVVTEFSTGITASSEPSGITAGPDGNLWFTENQGQKIGRITTAGVVTEFSTGLTAGSYPTAIVPGANGNLYFTERFGNRIGQITTAGVISEFSAGITSEGRPFGIAAGPDGNLWFTETAASKIGRFAIGGPINTVTPTVTGTAQHGQTLTLSTGTWTGNPTPTYTYSWQRCNTAGLECATISGATSSTYLLLEADIGKTIRGVVTGTNTLGVTPAPSAQTATVT